MTVPKHVKSNMLKRLLVTRSVHSKHFSPLKTSLSLLVLMLSKAGLEVELAIGCNSRRCYPSLRLLNKSNRL